MLSLPIIHDDGSTPFLASVYTIKVGKNLAMTMYPLSPCTQLSPSRDRLVWPKPPKCKNLYIIFITMISLLLAELLLRGGHDRGLEELLAPNADTTGNGDLGRVSHVSSSTYNPPFSLKSQLITQPSPRYRKYVHHYPNSTFYLRKEWGQ